MASKGYSLSSGKPPSVKKETANDCFSAPVLKDVYTSNDQRILQCDEGNAVRNQTFQQPDHAVSRPNYSVSSGKPPSVKKETANDCFSAPVLKDVYASNDQRILQCDEGNAVRNLTFQQPNRAVSRPEYPVSSGKPPSVKKETANDCFSAPVLKDVYASNDQRILQCDEGNAVRNQTFQQPDHAVSRPEEKEDKDRRIVLVGKTGSGKSATGNTILNRNAFISKTLASSVTQTCQKETGQICGKRIIVIDTPGNLFDTISSQDEESQEIIRCLALSAPGPHVFLLVLRLGRFTQEEITTFSLLFDRLGEQMNDFAIIVLTCLDELEEENVSIEDFISSNDALKDLTRTVGNRYIAINNRASAEKKSRQSEALLKYIDEIVDTHSGHCYTNDIYKKLEGSFRRTKQEVVGFKPLERNREVRKVEENYKQGVKPHKKELHATIHTSTQPHEKDKIEVPHKQKAHKQKQQIEAEPQFNEKHIQEKEIPRESEDMSSDSEIIAGRLQKMVEDTNEQINDLKRENEELRELQSQKEEQIFAAMQTIQHAIKERQDKKNKYNCQIM